jgi:nicotinate-nucleotide pyrophosphorylase (carboxylating)
MRKDCVKEFHQVEWDERTADDCRQLVRLAVREDLDRLFDVTTLALVSEHSRGSARVVVRQPGVLAGLPAAQLAVAEMNLDTQLELLSKDGDRVQAGSAVAKWRGSTRDLLTTERIVLNLLGRLSGIATLTRSFVDCIAGTRARIYDTRKTTPGWRRLEKYAVRCGGGCNHRTGLFDAVLIKDNHLAQGTSQGITPREAVVRARDFLAGCKPDRSGDIVEIEVDTLDQFRDVISAVPDIILLDNMSPEEMQEAVRLRDEAGAATQLEASGGVRLESVRRIAECGVDRISVGAVTHSATTLDIGLDWDATG